MYCMYMEEIAIQTVYVCFVLIYDVYKIEFNVTLQLHLHLNVLENSMIFFPVHSVFFSLLAPAKEEEARKNDTHTEDK